MRRWPHEPVDNSWWKHAEVPGAIFDPGVLDKVMWRHRVDQGGKSRMVSFYAPEKPGLGLVWHLAAEPHAEFAFCGLKRDLVEDHDEPAPPHERKCSSCDAVLAEIHAMTAPAKAGS